MQDHLGLAKYVLPEEIFRYFDIEKIEQEGRELHMYLEELNEIPEGYNRSDLESKGFHRQYLRIFRYVRSHCFSMSVGVAG